MTIKGVDIKSDKQVMIVDCITNSDPLIFYHKNVEVDISGRFRC